MTSQAELSPLFTDITMSADDAGAIVAALHDIAETDGKHDEEIEMIRGLVGALDAELGEESPTQLPSMSPDKLANLITDPTLRRVAVQCSVLLAWADGDYSQKERERVQAYATALGVTGADYESIEKTITDWVKSGDAEPLF